MYVKSIWRICVSVCGYWHYRLTPIFCSSSKALIRTTKEEGVGALYKGLLPNVLRGMAMNVGMLACYDQAKEVCAKLLNDPMTDGPSLSTKLLSSAVAVCGSESVCDVTTFDNPSHFRFIIHSGFHCCTLFAPI